MPRMRKCPKRADRETGIDPPGNRVTALEWCPAGMHNYVECACLGATGKAAPSLCTTMWYRGG